MGSFQNLTSFDSLFVAGNTVSGGFLFPTLIVTCWIVLFAAAQQGSGRNKAIVYSTFITMIVTGAAIIRGFSSDYYLIIVEGVMLAIGLYLLHENRS